MTRRLSPISLLVAVALLVAACSGSSSSENETTQLATLSDDGVAASGDDALAATSTTEVDDEVDIEEAMLDFAACMRETYPDWPDPDPDQAGGRFFSPETLEAAGVDFRSEEFRDVRQACEGENLQGVAGAGQERTPEEQAELEDNLLALFVCVREVPGFEDLPDPDFGGDGQGFGIRQLFEGGELDPAEFRNAMQECQTQLGIEGLGGPGGGRGGAGGGR